MTTSKDLMWQRPIDGKCTAHLRDGSGRKCQKNALVGQRVCASHGGAAPAAKAKARQRLDEATDRMVGHLLRMADDWETLPPTTRLAAIKDVLDRAGVSAPSKAELEISQKPEAAWEGILRSIAAGSREDSRKQREQEGEGWGSEQDPQLVSTSNVIDAEVVPEPQPVTAPTPSPPAAHYCAGCERKFPDTLPEGVTEYPEYCGDCR